MPLAHASQAAFHSTLFFIYSKKKKRDEKKEEACIGIQSMSYSSYKGRYIVHTPSMEWPFGKPREHPEGSRWTWNKNLLEILRKRKPRGYPVSSFHENFGNLFSPSLPVLRKCLFLCSKFLHTCVDGEILTDCISNTWRVRIKRHIPIYHKMRLI